jgi:hypothetical protein
MRRVKTVWLDCLTQATRDLPPLSISYIILLYINLIVELKYYDLSYAKLC